MGAIADNVEKRATVTKFHNTQGRNGQHKAIAIPTNINPHQITEHDTDSGFVGNQ
jgi:hypothetical protein